MQLVQDKAPHRVPAIRELGRRRDPILLDWAEEETVAEEAGQAAVDVDGVWHPMLYPTVFGALRRLPPELLLPRARDWVLRYPDHGVAVSILSDHGRSTTPRCPVRLRTHSRPVGVGRRGDLPSGLARWGVVEAVPLLLGMWEATPYAYGRRALLPALAVLNPEAAASLAGDALWDCEDVVLEAPPPSHR